MTHITLHGVSDAITGLVTISSVVFRWLMPPPDKFNDWPRFQGWYKLVYTFVQFAAQNK